MLKIDDSLLQEIGLGSLPETEKNGLLKHIYETLEMRVGMRLADQMSNEQLDEFEQYFEAKDDAGAFKWLEANFPNYKDIVQEEFDKLKLEVSQSAPQILAASQTASVAPPTPNQPLMGAQPDASSPAAYSNQPFPPQPTAEGPAQMQPGAAPSQYNYPAQPQYPDPSQVPGLSATSPYDLTQQPPAGPTAPGQGNQTLPPAPTQ